MPNLQHTAPGGTRTTSASPPWRLSHRHDRKATALRAGLLLSGGWSSMIPRRSFCPNSRAMDDCRPDWRDRQRVGRFRARRPHCFSAPGHEALGSGIRTVQTGRDGLVRNGRCRARIGERRFSGEGVGLELSLLAAAGCSLGRNARFRAGCRQVSGRVRWGSRQSRQARNGSIGAGRARLPEQQVASVERSSARPSTTALPSRSNPGCPTPSGSKDRAPRTRSLAISISSERVSSHSTCLSRERRFPSRSLSPRCGPRRRWSELLRACVCPSSGRGCRRR
jgi:hypothetical protein